MEEIKYYNRACLCGCGKNIEIKKWHTKKTIPSFIRGHATRLRDQCGEKNPLWKGGVSSRPEYMRTKKREKYWLNVEKTRDYHRAHQKEKMSRLRNENINEYYRILSRKVAALWFKKNIGISVKHLPPELFQAKANLVKMTTSIKREKRNEKQYK